MKVLKTLLIFSVALMYGQQNDYSYITDYYNLRTKKNKDSVWAYTNSLINSNILNKEAFGYAARAYLYSKEGDSVNTKTYFNKSLELLQQTTLKNNTELNGNIAYLRSLYYTDIHETEQALSIINNAIELCNETCSQLLHIKLISTKGRIYSLNNNHFEALKLSKITLSKIKKLPNYNSDYIVKKEYLKELVKRIHRSINIYYSDKEIYNVFLDSSKHLLKQAKLYAKDKKISDFNVFFEGINGDINFYKSNYAVAKNYYQIYSEFFKKNTKRKAHASFKIAECNFFLNFNKAAETTFLAQIESSIWKEYELLENEALCYLYLSKIYKQNGKTEKALNYSNQYSEILTTYLKNKSDSDIAIHKTQIKEKQKK